MKHLVLFFLVGSFLMTGHSAFAQKVPKEPMSISYNNLGKQVKSGWSFFQSVTLPLVTGGECSNVTYQEWFKIPAGAAWQGEYYTGWGTVYGVYFETYCFPGIAVFSSQGTLIGWDYGL